MLLGCLSCFFTNTIKRDGNRRRKEKEKENDIGPMGGPIYYERGYFLPFYL